jgi:hypothetical protein
MRRLSSFIALLLAFVPAVVFAQGFNPAQAPPWVLADSYGRWTIQGQAANNFVIQGPSICRITQLNFGDSSTFDVAAHNVGFAPILINDNNAQNAEVLTPASAFSNSTTCGWSLAATHPHLSFNLASGTAGLQEAINAVGPSTAPYPTVIYLTPRWYALVSAISSLNSTLASQVTPSNILAGAVCTSKVFVVDLTTLPATDYGCSGGALVVVTPGIISGVTITNTPSAAGQQLLTTSTSAAAWTSPVVTNLVGLTGTITGTALTAACDSGTATVAGAVAGDPVTVSSATGADLGAAFVLRASTTAANTVTVYVCAPVSGTPASLAYNVVVHHAASF